MGNSQTKIEKALAQNIPEHERIYGLANFGNTCYCNSVLQALYYCPPFRQRLQQHTYRQKLRHHKNSNTTSTSPTTSKEALLVNSINSNTNHREAIDEHVPTHKPNPDNLLWSLDDLFTDIASQRKKTGIFVPDKFIDRLRKENAIFNTHEQQDAHEFLNYLLNRLVEILKTEDQESNRKPTGTNSGNDKNRTWIQEIFEGTLLNETKCLCCESLSQKFECFLDLSIDIEPNSSITKCLKSFSYTETLKGDQKYFCEECNSLQEGEKKMFIKKFPPVLALHLKRFKYVENSNDQFINTKLSYKVVFPMELKLFNTCDTSDNPDQLFDLYAVVVHIGNASNFGHYITLVKTYDFWLQIDDGNVDVIPDDQIQNYFGFFAQEKASADPNVPLSYNANFNPNQEGNGQSPNPAGHHNNLTNNDKLYSKNSSYSIARAQNACGYILFYQSRFMTACQSSNDIQLPT